MNTELCDEITSVNAIYDCDVLSYSSDPDVVLLDVPGSSVRLRLRIPRTYPNEPPVIVGPETSGKDLKKGEASGFANDARIVLQRIFKSGEPCMFDLTEELKAALPESGDHDADNNDHSADRRSSHEEEGVEAREVKPTTTLDWTLSEVVTEKKSVFVARTTRVKDPGEAKAYVQQLLATDKKAAKATHNITAWRIRNPSTGIVYRDCDDDGETAAGGRLLQLLELMNVWNVMVVVSRWYGGIQLGPDRFRIINSVARDAIMKVGHVEEASNRESTKEKNDS